MEFLQTSKLYTLNKSTYVTLRWIAYIGQLIAIFTVQFILKFQVNYFICIAIICVSIVTNLYLKFKIKENQLSNLL